MLHSHQFSRRVLVLPALALLLLSAGGCSSIYYAAAEQVGIHKRDIMVDRVEDARDDQAKAKEQFQTALEKFQSVVTVEGGELEKKYNQLKSELSRCESRAKAVKDRIASIEDVSEALFKEWEKELEQYHNPELRRASERQLQTTRVSYTSLLDAMRRAERKMEPVLSAFQDQVLYLKHNLNAQAIASLQGTAVSLETDVAALVKEMEASIAEADEFISTLKQP